MQISRPDLPSFTKGYLGSPATVKGNSEACPSRSSSRCLPDYAIQTRGLFATKSHRRNYLQRPNKLQDEYVR